MSIIFDIKLRVLLRYCVKPIFIQSEKDGNMRNTQKTVISFFVLLLLIGCGVFNPSESDARLEFEKKWKEKLEDGTIKTL